MVTLSAAEMESTCYQCANGGQLGKWLRESGRKSLVEGVWSGRLSIGANRTSSKIT